MGSHAQNPSRPSSVDSRLCNSVNLREIHQTERNTAPDGFRPWTDQFPASKLVTTSFETASGENNRNSEDPASKWLDVASAIAVGAGF
jgi:hypothetical protein